MGVDHALALVERGLYQLGQILCLWVAVLSTLVREARVLGLQSETFYRQYVSPLSAKEIAMEAF